MEACNINKPYVFISYKREDKETVMKVVEELQSKYRVNIWIDTELASKGGTTWNSEATAAIARKTCKCVLFFMSDASMMSGPVLAELYFSQNSNKVKRNNGNNPLKIIPICLSQDLKNYGLSKWVYEILPDHEKAAEKIKEADITAWKEVDLPKSYIEGSDRITEISEIGAVISELIFENKDTITHIEAEASAIFSNIREYAGVCIESEQPAKSSKDSTAETVLTVEEKVEEPPKEESPKIKAHMAVNVKKDGVREIPVIESYAVKITRDMTLGEFEDLFKDDEFALYMRNLRAKGGKVYSKQMVDYLMSVLLRGCDKKAEENSAKWKYCTFAVASKVDLDNLTLGASQFTWQTNSRKAVSIEGSGKLGENSVIFEKLSSDMTIGDVEQKFIAGEKGFVTKDNEQIINAINALTA